MNVKIYNDMNTKEIKICFFTKILLFACARARPCAYPAPLEIGSVKTRGVKKTVTMCFCVAK